MARNSDLDPRARLIYHANLLMDMQPSATKEALSRGNPGAAVTLRYCPIAGDPDLLLDAQVTQGSVNRHDDGSMQFRFTVLEKEERNKKFRHFGQADVTSAGMQLSLQICRVPVGLLASVPAPAPEEATALSDSDSEAAETRGAFPDLVNLFNDILGGPKEPA